MSGGDGQEGLFSARISCIMDFFLKSSVSVLIYFNAFDIVMTFFLHAIFKLMSL